MLKPALHKWFLEEDNKTVFGIFADGTHKRLTIQEAINEGANPNNIRHLIEYRKQAKKEADAWNKAHFPHLFKDRIN